MYIPKSLKMKPESLVEQFIHDYGFAILVSDDLQATHLPFLYDSKLSEHGELRSHMARANPHWKQLDGQSVLVIFNGPHSYISPTWYVKGPAVPTWNYSAVHVYGKFETLSEDQTIQVVQDTVKKYEPGMLDNQDIMPDDYQQKLCKAIVSFRIKITKIEAKHKLGQQRSLDDQRGVLEALERSNNIDSVVLSQYMRKINVGIG